ncbi:hypothetical protein BK126_05290 [Paenibacillus sp. FSL H7-0326]|uniref:hypothetical protein n=1 Tax=Paenibacillus sp. FSL H7-0326 TaxID=1921144 RepID=UPI00096C11AB|nr:hypothetical protein [Paenibacillus sp. FSL H7-0326]OMC71494.1 hypothetical protein BK126_05290 [Paenibacillus sp. FSL H7-0326]
MATREDAKLFQRVKSLTVDNFVNFCNDLQTKAYGLAVTHFEQAMSCNEKIYKPTRLEVLRKAEQIREEWDGIHEVTIESTATAQYRTAEEIMMNMSPTELAIFKLETDAYFEIGGRTFYVKPVEEAKAQ